MTSLSASERRWKRGSATAGALIVLAVGSFITLVLVWLSALNNGAWAATPTERHQRLTWACVVFGVTITVFVSILWRAWRDPDRRV